MGAICEKRKQKDVKNLSSFGRNLGIVFQNTDDLIGIIGDSKVTKKPVGNDIREGKKSLPKETYIRLESRKYTRKLVSNRRYEAKASMCGVTTRCSNFRKNKRVVNAN